MSELRTYRAKFIDRIPRNFLCEDVGEVGTLIFQEDGHLLFIMDKAQITTSTVIAGPIHEGNKLIFQTKNSVYEFEILGEDDKSV